MISKNKNLKLNQNGEVLTAILIFLLLLASLIPLGVQIYQQMQYDLREDVKTFRKELEIWERRKPGPIPKDSVFFDDVKAAKSEISEIEYSETIGAFGTLSKGVENIGDFALQLLKRWEQDAFLAHKLIEKAEEIYNDPAAAETGKKAAVHAAITGYSLLLAIAKKTDDVLSLLKKNEKTELPSPEDKNKIKDIIAKIDLTKLRPGTLDYINNLLKKYCQIEIELKGGEGADIDLVFCIDTTKSMWDDIDAAKIASHEIINRIFASSSNPRIGLVMYRDYGDVYLNQARPFTSQKEVAEQYIKDIIVAGGGDTPEAVYEALLEAINFPWRDGVKKIIILIGDAPPHTRKFNLSQVEEAALKVDPAHVFPIAVKGFSLLLYLRLKK